MQNLLRRIKNKKGFTLMEMLIVVAIIVILVAVAVPVFTSQLDNAKEAADDANLRSAKALALTEYMTNENTFATEQCYHLDTGKFNTTKPSEAYGESKENSGKVIVAQYSGGEVKVEWKDLSSISGS